MQQNNISVGQDENAPAAHKTRTTLEQQQQKQQQLKLPTSDANTLKLLLYDFAAATLKGSATQSSQDALRPILSEKKKRRLA